MLPDGTRDLGMIAAGIIFICALDLLASRRRLETFTIAVPEEVRATLNETKLVAVAVFRRASVDNRPRRIRLGVVFPFEVEPVCDEVVVASPDQQQGIETELSLLGRQRGKFPLTQVLLGCASLLRLWDLRRTVAVNCQILVEPALPEINKQTAKLLASHRHGGQRIVARNGRGREFEQLREYVPSDDFGDIDWKATARKRRPIVREYRVERTQDIYACIDFSRLSAKIITRKDETQATILDEYVRSTLLLHRTVNETGDRFGFATFSNRVCCFVKAANPTSFNPVFRRTLYPLRPAPVAPAYDEICSALRSRAKRRALIVFFTSLAEPQLAEQFVEASRLLARQHIVVIACPADSHVKPLFADEDVTTVEDVYGKLAGHLLWKKLAALRANLSVAGIRMHSVAPGRLGLIAATEYLDIKERQLL